MPLATGINGIGLIFMLCIALGHKVLMELGLRWVHVPEALILVMAAQKPFW
jgi:hypothetical protein